MANKTPEIRSGQLGDTAGVRDYRAAWLGDVLVERVVWDGLSTLRVMAGRPIVDVQHVWFRFWLLAYEQVVERYYSAEGRLLGTQINVCMPPKCDDQGCRARDLILDIWIDPDGRVTVHNEDAFERAMLHGALTDEEACHAESHVRRLTAAIARGSFPPPLVRNWQINPSQIFAE